MLYKMTKEGGSLTFTEVGCDVEALCIGLLAACRLALRVLEKSPISWAVAEEAAGVVRSAIDRAVEEQDANLPTLQ